MSQFLYLYRGGRNGNPSPEQAQQIMQKWMTWLKGLGEQGHLKDQGDGWPGQRSRGCPMQPSFVFSVRCGDVGLLHARDIKRHQGIAK